MRTDFPAEMPEISEVPVDQGVMFGILAGLGIIWLVFVLFFYIYNAVCLMKIAQKTGAADGWWAWIPILNILLMFKLAGKPLWWILLILIPLVNIIILVVTWMAITERVGKPSYWGILMIVPVIGFFVPAYLAFSKDGGLVQPQQVQPPPAQTTPQV